MSSNIELKPNLSSINFSTIFGSRIFPSIILFKMHGSKGDLIGKFRIKIFGE